MLKHGYTYDILPRSVIGRIGVLTAFVCGPLSIVALVLIGPTFWTFEGPCGSQEYPGCLGAQNELASESVESCAQAGHDVCVAPLGRVSPDLVRRLELYYEDTYGLSLGVLTPKAIPRGMANEDRAQVAVEDLANFLVQEFGEEAYGNEPLVIGLTPMDVYFEGEDWYWAFGSSYPQAVISTARMDPASFGHPDDDRLYSRAKKMVSKYIGARYYALGMIDDPESQMYNHIRSAADLDKMSDEPLELGVYHND